MQLKTSYGSKVEFMRFFNKEIIWVTSELGPNHILVSDLDEESKKKVVDEWDKIK
jgi:hypothetical protein